MNGSLPQGVIAPRPAPPALERDALTMLLHDLAQPLTALTNYLGAARIALEQDVAPDDLAGLIADASAEAARARALVGRMRELLSR